MAEGAEGAEGVEGVGCYSSTHSSTHRIKKPAATCRHHVQGRNAARILSARTDVEADVTPFSHALRSVPSSAGRVCAIWVCASGPHHHGEEDEAGGSRRQKVECEHHHLRAPGRHSEVGSAADHHARASREGTATGSSIEVARRLNQIKRSSAAEARTSRRPSAGCREARSLRTAFRRKEIYIWKRRATAASS